MTMRMLHAVVAVLTFILLFIRHTCAITACPSSTKRRRFPVCLCSFGGTSMTDMPLLPADCLVCAQSSCFFEECGQPKYKRDPDISVDNENILQHPHD